MTKETEWLSEPNQLSWQYEGYDCLITRNEKYGNLQGFVGLKSGHPWYGLINGYKEIYSIDVHGGIACASSLYPIPGIYIKGPRWWLGFSAATPKDYRPFYKDNDWDSTYKNLEFMKAECEKLVRQCQVAEIKKKNEKEVTQKPYTCDCKYSITRKEIKIGVCKNKDPENIRLCILATKIWEKLIRRFAEGDGKISLMANINFRHMVFEVLADEQTFNIKNIKPNLV